MNSLLRLAIPAFACLPALLANPLAAQSPERWFQIEIAVFTNENPVDRDAEIWQPGGELLRYPAAMERLANLMDLLAIDDLLLADTGNAASQDPALIDQPVQTIEDYIRSTGPHPITGTGEFSLHDFARDPFVQLPAAASNFQQTNRAIERAANHRLLWHGLWRQPVRATAEAIPLFVSGGARYGDQHELQGSVTIRFNPNADRVVIDADLWLSEFSIVPDDNANWDLPAVPERLRRAYEQDPDPAELDYYIRRIYRMRQSRDMRSTEFHYLDHPALGLVILVEPYDVPPAQPGNLESGNF